METLRSKIVRLASTKPELRGHLLPILKKAEAISYEETKPQGSFQKPPQDVLVSVRKLMGITSIDTDSHDLKVLADHIDHNMAPCRQKNKILKAITELRKTWGTNASNARLVNEAAQEILGKVPGVKLASSDYLVDLLKQICEVSGGHIYKISTADESVIDRWIVTKDVSKYDCSNNGMGGKGLELAQDYNSYLSDEYRSLGEEREEYEDEDGEPDYDKVPDINWGDYIEVLSPEEAAEDIKNVGGTSGVKKVIEILEKELVHPTI